MTSGLEIVDDFQKLLRKLFVYDPETGTFTRIDGPLRRTAKRTAPRIAGHTRADKRVRIYVGGKKFNAHRLAWIYTHGPIPDGMQIDHINRNPSDNRLANLRLATESENKINIPRSTPCGFRGVYLHRGLWAAKIRKKPKLIWLGYFPDPESAARAYDAKARELHGEFAILNFPNDRAAA